MSDKRVEATISVSDDMRVWQFVCEGCGSRAAVVYTVNAVHRSGEPAPGGRVLLRFCPLCGQRAVYYRVDSYQN